MAEEGRLCSSLTPPLRLFSLSILFVSWAGESPHSAWCHGSLCFPSLEACGDLLAAVPCPPVSLLPDCRTWCSYTLLLIIHLDSGTKRDGPMRPIWLPHLQRFLLLRKDMGTLISPPACPKAGFLQIQCFPGTSGWRFSRGASALLELQVQRTDAKRRKPMLAFEVNRRRGCLWEVAGCMEWE